MQSQFPYRARHVCHKGMHPEQPNAGGTPLFGQPVFGKINFHYVSLKRYLILYAEQN